MLVMNPTAMLIAALATLPAVGLVAWVWFSMTQVEADLHTFSTFEGLHFDV